MGTFSHVRSSFRQAHFLHIVVSLMPSRLDQFFNDANDAKLLRSDGVAAGNSKP
jgi:hypothetical protein